MYDWNRVLESMEEADPVAERWDWMICLKLRCLRWGSYVTR